VNVNIMLAGEAGQGVQSAGHITASSFAGRGFAGEPEHLAELFMAGIQHRGFALIDILQPCVSFNRVNTWDWYRARVYKLDAGYDPTNKAAAFEKSQEWGERIPIGIIYRRQGTAFEDRIAVLKGEPPARQQPEPGRVRGLMDAFK